MKTNTSNDDRLQNEGHSSFSRRRLTRIPHSRSSNGSFENDLALAVQESLRYAKLAEKKKVEKSGKRGLSEIENTMDNSSGKEQNGQQGVKQLKELLLAHVDLVQHQQEMILQKDKEIKSLKEERDAVSLNCPISKILFCW